jgi:hypothetical protein
MYRETKINIVQRLGIDQEAYALIRDQKRVQKKSMAEIVCNLIKKTYGEH